MTHRVIIINKMRETFEDEEVRAEMTPAQCAEVDALMQCTELTIGQFSEALFRLFVVYAKEG